MDAVVNRADLEAAAAKEPPYPPAPYAWYVVGVLLFAYTLSFIDRMILSLLIGPIREALKISDTEVSLLVGMAFALFYTLMGLPLGWLADRGNRTRLIAAGVSLWSLMTAACGLAGSYGMLFLARMGVGVGEATLTPAAFSLLSDYFPRDKLARAIAVYSIGVPLGSGVAMILGAFVIQAVLAAPPVVLPLVGELEAWRTIFFWVAAPGLLAVLLMATVREPFRRGRAAASAQTKGGPSLIAFLSRQGAPVWAHIIGMSLITVVMYGLLAWTPTFLQRTYGMPIGQAGLWFGIVMGVCGAAGVLLGGWVADRMFAKGKADAHLRTMRLSILLGGPLMACVPLMPSAALALGLMVPALTLVTMHGVAGGALQLVTPNELRARVSALYVFVVNLVGLGLGPTAMALMTDFVFGDDKALRYSIALTTAIALPLAALVLTLGLKPYARAVRALEEAGA